MIRGILFDKDGTLLDFDALWLGVGQTLAAGFLREMKVARDPDLERALLESIGVLPDGVVGTGAFASGTYADCGDRFADTLRLRGIAVDGKAAGEILARISDEAVMSESAAYRPVADLARLFGLLKYCGVICGMVTADTQDSAIYAAERLGISDRLDMIVGASGDFPFSKPSSAPAELFCGTFGLAPSEIAVIGDTLTDMRFARNAGALAVGVASGVCGENEMREYTDLFLPNVGAINENFIHAFGGI